MGDIIKLKEISKIEKVAEMMCLSWLSDQRFGTIVCVMKNIVDSLGGNTYARNENQGYCKS